jgi:hypothetical protein
VCWGGSVPTFVKVWHDGPVRLALLTADVGNSMPNLGDYFITHAIERYFSHCDRLRVPMHQRPDAALISQLKHFDALIVCGTNIVGIGNSVRLGFTLGDFEAVGRPVIPLGLGSQADLGCRPTVDQTGRDLLSYWYESSGPISVRDAMTFDLVESVLGKGSAVLTGCPSLLLEEAVTPHCRRPVFAPGAYHYRPNTCDWPFYRRYTASLYRALSATEPTLYLAQQPDDFWFEEAAVPGIHSLHSAMAPRLQLRAIGSASRLLTFRIHPGLMALTHRVPTYLIALDERTRGLAESVGLPYEVLSHSSTVAGTIERFERRLADYPWEVIEQRLEEKRELLRAHFIEKGLGHRSSAHFPRAAEMPLRICVITDRNYLPLLVGLLENLIELEDAPIVCHCLVLEDGCAALLQETFPSVSFQFWDLDTLWGFERSPTIRGYPRAEQAYASKPKLLQRALEQTRAPFLFVDCDLLFFRSPRHLASGLGSSKVLLFPQYNDAKVNSRTHGVYNSGLILVAPGAEPFLEWWNGASFLDCGRKISESQFYEQGYLDLAPALFEDIKVYAGADENIGPWSVRSVGLEWDPWEPGRASLFGDAELGSYHAAYPDPLGGFEIKSVRDQLATFFHARLAEVKSPLLYATVVTQQARYWPALRRAVFLFETLNHRCRFSRLTLSELWVGWFVKNPVRAAAQFVSVWYGRLRALKRKLQKRAIVGQTVEEPWHALQRFALYRRRTSNSVPLSGSMMGVKTVSPSGKVTLTRLEPGEVRTRLE